MDPYDSVACESLRTHIAGEPRGKKGLAHASLSDKCDEGGAIACHGRSSRNAVRDAVERANQPSLAYRPAQSQAARSWHAYEPVRGQPLKEPRHAGNDAAAMLLVAPPAHQVRTRHDCFRISHFKLLHCAHRAGREPREVREMGAAWELGCYALARRGAKGLAGVLRSTKNGGTLTPTVNSVVQPAWLSDGEDRQDCCAERRSCVIARATGSGERACEAEREPHRSLISDE